MSPAMFWFAGQRKESYLLWNEWPKIAARAAKKAGRSKRDRDDPLLMLWLAPTQEKPTAPTALSWSAQGTVPVAFHRSAWTADASYVAIKGGTPSANHAHMDVGAFVMDADGVRWADGTFARADVILWCTGFRSALDHLAPLRLRGPGGGITMTGRLATQVAADPRIHLLGYGPSASTIGANRAGRAAVRELLAALAD